MALARHISEVFVHSIGTPMPIPNTTLIAHHEIASEEVTLHSLWEHCRENRTEKVIYLHSKGSFHGHRANDLLRMFVTRGALSKECTNLPLTCNFCSSRMSPIPHPIPPGNMWLAVAGHLAQSFAYWVFVPVRSYSSPTCTPPSLFYPLRIARVRPHCTMVVQR